MIKKQKQTNERKVLGAKKERKKEKTNNRNQEQNKGWQK